MINQCSKKLVKYKECSCFDHFEFSAHSVTTYDVCWGSLGTSISGTQVQPQIILDSDYLPDYISVSDDSEITMKTRQMTPFFSSALRALFVGTFHFCISKPSKFTFVESPPCFMFWSVKYIFTCKRWYFQVC